MSADLSLVPPARLGALLTQERTTRGLTVDDLERRLGASEIEARDAANRTTRAREQATELITGLLRNVYGAFDYRDEEMIYDTLERSVTGNLLTETYLETRRGLELASQGGARAKVKAIEMVEVDASPEGTGFVARSTWNVAASVGHWGHIHTRQNVYDAILTLAVVDGSWKISGIDLLEEKRVDPFATKPSK